MRYSDWQSRLAAFIEIAKTKSFAWGENDCALFACDCIKAETGHDPAASFRGKYNDRNGAYKALQDFAGGGLAETMIKIATDMNAPEVAPAFAQRGDAVLCLQDNHDTMGIVDLSGRAVMIAAKQGIIFHPFSIIKRAWRVE